MRSALSALSKTHKSTAHTSLTYLPTCTSCIYTFPSQWRLFQQHQHPVAHSGFEDLSLRKPLSGGNTCWSLPSSLFIPPPANNLSKTRASKSLLKMLPAKQTEIYPDPENEALTLVVKTRNVYFCSIWYQVWEACSLSTNVTFPF